MRTEALPKPRTAKPTLTERGIAGIYPAPPTHWVGDGFRVAGYFSAIPDAVRKLSPFLLLDYHPTHDYPPSEGEPRGVGTHPHRGFETVTIAFQGSVAHQDSAGNGGVIGPGDVQWMTAAAGILHQEYHEEGYARRGGPFQMAQLWVNLPKAHKMSPPRYQGITRDRIGTAELADRGGTVRVIAGEYEGVKGPAKTFSEVHLFEARLSANGKLPLAFPARHNVAVVVMDGTITVGDHTAKANDFVLFANDGDRITIEATTEAHLLVLGGEPIDEPVVQYGPFVMNTREEIVQAVVDFERGAFGSMADGSS